MTINNPLISFSVGVGIFFFFGVFGVIGLRIMGVVVSSS